MIIMIVVDIFVYYASYIISNFPVTIRPNSGALDCETGLLCESVYE